MKKLSRKFKIWMLALIIAGFSISTIVFADGIALNNKAIVSVDDNSISKISDRTVSDTHKVWTIRFNSSIDADSFANSVQVRDLTTGSTEQISTTIGEDNSSIKINPSEQGYKVGHNYEITVGKNIKSNKGKNLKKSTVMGFKVIDVASGNNTASAKVVVSPVLPMFKQITINSIDLSDVKTIKISGNDKVFNVGEAALSFVGENTTTLYFYGSDGKTVIAKGDIDVSQSRDNVTIKLTNGN